MKLPERALVLLKPQFLGDAVMACPLIDAASASFERVVVSCGAAVQQVLQDRAAQVGFLEGRKISGIVPILRSARQLRSEGFQTAFLVNRSFRSALAVRLAGIPVRVGHATESRGRLLTHGVRYEKDRFEAECSLDLIRELRLPTGDPRPRIQIGAEEVAEIALRMDNLEIGVQPGARYPAKQVPLAVMAQVVDELMAQNHNVVLLGGQDEASSSAAFQTMLARPLVSHVGKLSIRESMAAAKSLKLMIGSDTGLMHLAVAVGCPTVTVFGPNPAKKWAHAYPPHRFIAAPNRAIRQVAAASILEQVELALA